MVEDKQYLSQAQCKWDGLSEFYERTTERFTFQAMYTLLTMIDSKNKKRILETACATGMHSELIARNFIGPGTLLVSSDFSP